MTFFCLFFYPGFVVNDEPDVSYRVQFYDGQIVSIVFIMI